MRSRASGAALLTSPGADGLDGVRVVRHDAGTTVLDLDPEADDQAVLAAALLTGPVHDFTRQQASLSELYREVVAS